MEKMVYHFDEGSKEQKELLGGKGANLAEMTNLGLPVPHGFTITTEACRSYLIEGQLVHALKQQIMQALMELEERTGKTFWGEENPLLVSVRSGAKFSMPGMMDTILNLGLNDVTVETLARATGDERFAYDCYRRLLQMYGDVVCGIPKAHFEEYLTKLKQAKGYLSDAEIPAEDWQTVVQAFQQIYVEELGQAFPQDPYQQLFLAVEAVFRSWNNPRAKTYRRLHGIPDELGTAVNIQEMVFGNFGETSATGVAFTRNPATGEKGIFGEFLLNAQGEDVVAGIRTPLPLSEMAKILPSAHAQFLKIADTLEQHYRDMQDIEFTIEHGQLFLLQTRNGKRTPKAAIRIAVDLSTEGILPEEEMLLSLTPEQVSQVLYPVFDEQELAQAPFLFKGLPASPGAASGKIYFTAEEAKEAHERGEKVILLRQETSPEDIEGMAVSEAIVTSTGGMTSHAAVVARGMGVCCVVGCDAIHVNERRKLVTYAGGTLQEGDIISVDGSTGKIYLGEIERSESGDTELLNQLTTIADKHARLKVRANAETPKDIETALAFGAAGVGLVRTEHMFFEEGRIHKFRRMILSGNRLEMEQSLAHLKEAQKEDFRQIFQILAGQPATIRLLDPPLHEFLPRKEEEIASLAEDLGISYEEIQDRIDELGELNPMLGHRGCRLAVTNPGLYEMQVGALVESALEVQRESGRAVKAEIMIPLVGSEKELRLLKDLLQQRIAELVAESGLEAHFPIGTMIEIPRACLAANRIAEEAAFFSFGTNDLTQMTYGFSRDDSGKFLDAYINKGLLAADPFQHLDQEGVGELIAIAIERGKQVKPDLKIGVCGEVAGDPESIAFLNGLAIDYISCSPFRVVGAKLAAAQSELRRKQTQNIQATAIAQQR